MPELVTVTLTVPLILPLTLVNAIAAESERSHTSIPEMLSCMLVDAFEGREQQEFDAALNAQFSPDHRFQHSELDHRNIGIPTPARAGEQPPTTTTTTTTTADDDDDECGGKSPPAPPSQ